MQLVAYGAQDIYLTGNPQITFFKIVYRRHTNFALESIEQTFNGNPGFNKRVTCTVSRNGDLIHKTYLRVTLPAVTIEKGSADVGFRWLDWIGHVLIKTVEIEIGGQRIDKHYGEWLHIWNELTQTAGHALGYANMVGNVPALTGLTTVTAAGSVSSTTVPSKTLYIPLQFWFCRNPGLALPLIALQYHEIKINIEFRDIKDCYWAGTKSSGAWTTNLSAVTVQDFNASLFIDYVYLDTEERRRYAQVAHEFLIDQLQFTGDESTSSTSNKIKLNFNHPTKELVWVVQNQEYISDGAANIAAFQGKQWFNWTDTWEAKATSFGASNYVDDLASGGFSGAYGLITSSGNNPVSIARLQLNGHDRTQDRDGDYYNLVQPYQHHTNIPSSGVNVYSFALRPEEHQPSGTCNMSRIDSAVLNMTLRQGAIPSSGQVNVKVFAVNYNVLRLMSGMGGLAYAN